MPITLRLTPANGQEAAARRELTDFVERTSGQTLAACYQCAKCAAGCPLAAAMDLAPQQIIRALQLGQPDLALHSQTLWLCVGCQTCATRCPCNVELPRIMDALRLWAETHGPQPTPRDIPTFHHVFLKSVELTGRAYEIGLIGGYNLLSRHLLSGFDLAPPMLRRGKIKLLPQRVRARREIAGIFRRADEVRRQQTAAPTQKVAQPAAGGGDA
ncbi:MAG: 4Fe-4S dicluster domain-containing protein [Anaerolineae bacterium]|uniref:4Fe-4S dicluster domain-containing protein n=1 Tax=Candidatus Amarolinea dominans TaxID=3140696 RepID=UPI00313680FC|nr:4Fe-4S dicluster domain-containing protein [Anaerolineae bacterium]